MTYRQRLFVAAFLGPAAGNAVKAAAMAGYSCPDANAHRIAAAPPVRAAIDAKVAEAALSSDEVLAHLSDQAQGDMGDFANLVGADKDEARAELLRLRKAGKARLIKRITPTKHGIGVELYDAQAALKLLGNFRGLWAEKLQVGQDLDWDAMSVEQLQELANGSGPAYRRNGRGTSTH